MEKTCQICGFKGSRGINSLLVHLKKSHRLTLQQHYDKHLAQRGDGKCAECSKATKWSDRYQTYNKFCSRKCQTTNVANRPEQKSLMRRVMSRTMERVYGKKSKKKKSRAA